MRPGIFTAQPQRPRSDKLVMASSPFRLSVLTYNAHLWGKTAMIHDDETGLYFKDHVRNTQIISCLDEADADIIGITELFDRDMGNDIERELKYKYPYVVPTTYHPGIPLIAETLEERIASLLKLTAESLRLPRRLTSPIERRLKALQTPETRKLAANRITTYFGQRHYDVRDSLLRQGLDWYFTEDRVIRLVEKALDPPLFWGAGLMLLSKLPIVDTQFHEHPIKAGVERLSGKGVIEAIIKPEGGKPITVYSSHFQDGASKAKVDARHGQVAAARQLIRGSRYPVIFMGDFNVTAETTGQYTRTARQTDEYKWLKQQLGLQDGYRKANPNADKQPGYTYDHDTPFSTKFGVNEAKEFTSEGDGRRQRIDYVWHSRDFVATDAAVLGEQFRNLTEQEPLSDHIPLSVILQFEP